jgi:hypothetical protein
VESNALVIDTFADVIAGWQNAQSKDVVRGNEQSREPSPPAAGPSG